MINYTPALTQDVSWKKPTKCLDYCLVNLFWNLSISPMPNIFILMLLIGFYLSSYSLWFCVCIDNIHMYGDSLNKPDIPNDNNNDNWQAHTIILIIHTYLLYYNAK